MSIDDDLLPVASITEGDRALELFTDRYSFTRLLAERLNDPPKQEILFFHGVGGNGKSLLLKYLRKKICKGLTAEQWQQVKSKPDDELAKSLEDLGATQYLPVPTALLDFASGSIRRDIDPFYGLVRIREELAASTAGTPYRLRFPLHTYGCFLYLQKTNRLDEVKSLFPFEEAELVKEFGDLIEKPIPGLGFAISLFGLVDKYSGNQLARYQKRFRLDASEVERLQRMDAEKELLLELPRLLAQDLNVAMAGTDVNPYKPTRVILFFDTHESFYGTERDHATNFFRDGWLRRLLRKLDTAAGIVVVVAGRDKPLWTEAGKHDLNTQIPMDYVQLKSVDDLTETDAEIFLTRAGVTDGALRESLISYASVETNRVHPLHLGLCADVVLEAAAKAVMLVPGDFSEVAKFREKSTYLIEQLLKYADDGLRDAIWALSACRVFSFEIYQLLGKALGFDSTTATFRRLVGFSFVRQIGTLSDGQYRIHDLLRRLLDDETVVQAHELLAKHYETQGGIEEIYHVNCLNWSQGIDLWLAKFSEGLELSQYDLCRALLSIRSELIIKTIFEEGRIDESEGDYFRILSFYDEAKNAFEKAAQAYTKDLITNPHNVITLLHKGNSLLHLADIQIRFSHYDDAQDNLEKAIAAYNVAVHLDSEYMRAHSNKGNALQSLGDLQTILSQYGDAQVSFTSSIAAYDSALHIAFDAVDTINNKGVSYQKLASLQTRLLDHRSARLSLDQAAAAYEKVLSISPGRINTLINIGNVLQQLADSQLTSTQYDKAQANYKTSIEAYDSFLRLIPGHVGVLKGKGNSLQKLADAQIKLFHPEDAQESYEKSIEIYDGILVVAPNDVGAFNNRGNSFLKLADLQVGSAQQGLARDSYESSISSYDSALELAPKRIETINSKGFALLKIGNFHTQQSQKSEALSSWQDAFTMFSLSLKISPNQPSIRQNKEKIVRFLSDQNKD